MNLRKTLLVSVAALSTIAVAATSASAAYRHHHHRGYGAYAQQYTGPGSMNFQNGGGWNNGETPNFQYGHPDHW